MTVTSTKKVLIRKADGQTITETEDFLAIEEPLEIQLIFGVLEQQQRQSISITMRTPGNDFELAAGFLYTEGIVQSKSQIKQINYASSWNPDTKNNIVTVHLAAEVVVDLKKLERHFYTTSSCGVCGKTSIEALAANGMPSLKKDTPKINPELIHHLPDKLRLQQSIFENTGGIHAAGLFDTNGNLLLLREDVGRHNAVDKLIGAALMEDRLPLLDSIIVVSGRASFELIQKSLMAGIPMLVAVGAPSSLAVELADENNMTVIGFTRNQKYNIYCHPERIK